MKYFILLLCLISVAYSEKLFVQLNQYQLDPSACTSGYSGFNGDGGSGYTTGYITTGTSGTDSGSSSGGSSSGGGGSSGNYCDKSQYIGQTYYPLDTCIYFGGYYITFTKVGNKVNTTSYGDDKCKLEYDSDFGTGVMSPGQCVNLCSYNPFTISVVSSSAINIPKGTLETIQYPSIKECNSNYEGAVAITYSYLNTCLIDFQSKNYYYTCNSTTVNTHKSFAKDCSKYNGLSSFQVTCGNTWANGVLKYICNQ